MTEPSWLTWAKQLQATAQSGLAFSKDPYDIERYEQIMGISAEILSTHTNTPSAHILTLFQQENGYATPKTGCRAAIVRWVDGEPQLLMVQEKLDNLRWTMPGGYCDIGDTPAEATIRETKEETGYDVRVTKLMSAYYRNRLPNCAPRFIDLYQFVFLCEVVGGAPQSNMEVGDIRWFAENEIPLDDLSIGRTNPLYIPMIFQHARQPNLSTAFN